MLKLDLPEVLSAKIGAIKLTKFTGIYSTALSVAIFWALLIPGYIGQAPSRVFSYYINDGTCHPEIQGVGVHCFGDFYYNIAVGRLDNPWASVPNPNPPLMQIFYSMFEPVTENRIGLLLYLSFLMTLTLIPLILIARNRIIPNHELSLLVIFVLTCSPVLIAIDRGSFSIAFFPLTFLLFYSHVKNQKLKENIILTLMVLLKPQMILFNLILIRTRPLVSVVKISVFQALISICSFGLYGENVFDLSRQYLKQAISYQNYTPWGSLFPVNISITNFIGTPLKILGLEERLFLLRILLTAFIMIFLLFKLYKHKNCIGPLESFTLVTLTVILLPGVTFPYYLCLLLTPIVITLIMSLNDNTDQIDFVSRNRTASQLGKTSLILLFIPWTIPFSAILPDSLDSYLFANVGLNWYPGLILLHLFYLSILFRSGSIENLKHSME